MTKSVVPGQMCVTESIVPGQPRGLQARGMEHSVLINWLPPVDTDVKIRGYVLTYGIGAPFGFRVVLNDKLTTYTIRDLCMFLFVSN